MKVLIKIWQSLTFIGFYLRKLIMANLYLAYDILTYRFLMNPAIIKVPITVKTGHEILTLVSLITMTPGTLILEISKNKKHIYIHGMYVDNVDDFIKEIKHLEEKIQQLYK